MALAHDFNLRHLRAVLAVVERGTVSAAAEDVALSQPALTQGLAKVEALLGVSLFERRSTGMVPTMAGALLASRVRAAAALLAEAMRAARRGESRGFVRADLLVTMAHLRGLIALAREGGYLAAARSLGVSQPAVHRAVRDLERLTGLTVVERRGKGVALTRAGARVVRAARLALGEIQAALDEIAAMAGVETGRIVIGAMPLARAWLLPTTVARFHAAEPGINLDIAEGSHAELIEPLRDGEFDLLIGALRELSPGPDVAQEALFDDRLAIFARAGHRLQDRAALSIAEIAAEQWLVPREGTPLRAQWEAMFLSEGVQPPVARIECGSVMMLRGMMLEGEYLTLLSPDQLWVELRGGLLAMLVPPTPLPTRSIGITTRADWRPTSAQQRFVELLRDVARDHRINRIE